MKTGPISKFQEQFWFLNMMAPKSPAYNIPAVFKFNKLPDIDILEKTINKIVDRHEILRTHYQMQDGKLFQVIQEPGSCLLQVKQVFVDEDLNGSIVPEIINSEVNTPFDLAKSPLLRCKVFQFRNGVFLCIVFHHIAIDVHSKVIFENEFSEIYNAILNNRAPELLTINNNYLDYANWQNQWIESDKASEMVNAWINELPQANSLINLPIDHTRPTLFDLKGQRNYFELTAKVSSDIKKLATEKSVNSFVILLSCYAVFLNRITNQKNIVIGVPLSNRKQEDFKNTFGPFVNVVPLFLDFSDIRSFDDVLKQVKFKMLLAHRKQEVPFLTIVNASKEGRNPSFNPYFQTGFTFEPRMIFNLEGIDSSPVPIERKGTQLDLFLTMWEHEGLFQMFWEYSTDLFEQPTIQKFHKSFARVVDYFLSGKSSLSGISYLPDQKLIVTDGTEKPIFGFEPTLVEIKNQYVHELFEKQASISGGKTAVISNNEALTYSQLDTLANKISNYIIEKGVRGNDVVGISLNRSTLMLASVLGILKSGAAYLPLDPSFPNDRLSYMLSDSGAKLLITETLLETNIQTEIEKVIIDDLLNEIEKQPGSKPHVQITPDSLAYLIYTSGSTGLPKGVKVHHLAVTNFIESMASVPGFTANDTLLAVTTLSFDISVLELFLPLYTGGKIVLAQRSEVINGSALIKLIEKNSVTVLQATPVTWNILLQSGWTGNNKLKALCGGEAIPIQLIKELLPKVAELWNMYGPTETTVWSTCCRLVSPEPPVLVGKPINNTTVYILAEDNSMLPIGSAGEVCIGGVGVSKGYHNRQELTSEKFIHLESGELIYKTGDLGKLLPDGQIELFGRIDNQIKLRGFRIEPGEIEVQICKVEGVQEAVVKVQNFGGFDERLVAFLNVNSSFLTNNDEIITFLKTNLPDYMIPLNYKIMDEFPRTPNGKIDKKKLIFQDSDIQIKTEVNEIPASDKDVEKKVLEIWENTIKKQNINIDDNFFDIGGNSIMVLQMASKINEFIGKEINILTYFEHPTVRSFVNFVKSDNNSLVNKNDSPSRQKHLMQLGQRRRNQN